MGDRSKDMEHQFAGGQGAPKVVEAGDAKTVAGAGMVDELAEPRALELSSGDHVNEDADGASLPQPVFLAGDILVSGRHAGIAQDISFAGCPAGLFNTRFRDGLSVLNFGPVQGTQIVSLSVSILWEISKRQTAFWRRAMASKCFS